ncbi:hypothetical protein OF83DRAFT_475607 [Amylostereum chailletii]|nr:hypothetical protein OF83DRAFT_475607 [Amylostereum chailletii]
MKHTYRTRSPSRHWPRRSLFPPSILGVVVCLLSASTSCFLAALYLTVNPPRGAHQRFEQPRHSIESDLVLVEITPSSGAHLPSALSSADERYLSYLPHSGFHNQRIALENALILSRILNRTLLVPPARLGKKPIHYIQSTALRRFLILSGKESLWHCAHIPSHVTLPPECDDFFDYTHVSWTWLVNFAALDSEQPIVHSDTMTYPWLDGSIAGFENDTWRFEDKAMYEFRFVDADKPTLLSRYASAVPISTLAAEDARHIQLGTLFGSSRIHLKDPQHLAIRKSVRENMALSNPILNQAAQAAKHVLGGTYVGAHVRLGDGHFVTAASNHVRVAWYKMVMRVLGIGIDEAYGLERRFDSNKDAGFIEGRPPEIPVHPATTRSSHPPLDPLPDSFSPRLSCRRPLHTDPDFLRLNVPLFISTDARTPASDPLFVLFSASFPCMFFLSDLLPLFSSWSTGDTPPLKDLDRLVSSYDGVPLQPFLVPFMDAMIAANGWTVVGTEGSTFSTFMEDVLWRRSHGFEIVQRG